MTLHQSKWDVTCGIDFEAFSSGDELTFVRAKHDNSNETDGFKFEVYGLIDPQGRFHVIGHSVEPVKEEQ